MQSKEWRNAQNAYMPPRERTNADVLPSAPTRASSTQFPHWAAKLRSVSKLYSAQMNASHFLFTFDLPLSPKKTEKKKRGGGGRSQTEGGGERKKRGEEKWGAGELLLLLSPYLLSLSLYFFSFCLSKGKLDGQSFATSSLQLVHLTRHRSSFLAVGSTNPNSAEIAFEHDRPGFA